MKIWVITFILQKCLYYKKKSKTVNILLQWQSFNNCRLSGIPGIRQEVPRSELGRIQLVTTNPRTRRSFRESAERFCLDPPRCNPVYPYRTADGSCNNLFNPILGKAFTPQSRILPNAYDNCKSDCSQKFNSNLKNSLKKAHSLWKHQKIVLVKCVFLPSYFPCPQSCRSSRWILLFERPIF